MYNYVFLTNQATIFPTNDPDALGGLFPEGNVDQGFDFTFTPEQLFRGWTVSIMGYGDSPVGNVYEMRFVNEEPDALVGYVDAKVVDGEWRPYTMTFYNPENAVLAAITLTDFTPRPRTRRGRGHLYSRRHRTYRRTLRWVAEVRIRESRTQWSRTQQSVEFVATDY